MAEEVVSGTNNFTSWKTGIDTQLNTIRSEGVSHGNPTDAEKRILQTVRSDLQVITDCIKRKTACIAKLGTTNAGTQDAILALKEQIASEEEAVAIAQQRLSYVRAPDQTTSFYQSWFPLDRPIKRISVPILSGFIFFFLLLSIGTIVMLFGMNLAFYNPSMKMNGNSPGPGTSFWSMGQAKGATNASIQARYKEIQKQAQQKQQANQQAQKTSAKQWFAW